MVSRIPHTGIAALLAAALAFPAAAQSLRIKQAQFDAEIRYAETLASTNAACGTAIEAGFVWEGFKAEDFDGKSVPGYCAAPLEAMRDLCGASDNGLAKAAIAEAIRRVQCVREPERAMSLAEGVLTYSVSFDSSNDFYYARDWLLDNL